MTKVRKLKDKAYREAYIGSQVFTTIPYQVRALRKRRKLDQKALAAKAGMKQSRISAIENPSGNKLNLETLIRLAVAFDVGLVVRFAPFSELLKIQADFQPDSFDVPTFQDELDLGVFDGSFTPISKTTFVPQYPAISVLSAQTFGIWGTDNLITAPVVNQPSGEQVPYAQVQ